MGLSLKISWGGSSLPGNKFYQMVPLKRNLVDLAVCSGTSYCVKDSWAVGISSPKAQFNPLNGMDIWRRTQFVRAWQLRRCHMFLLISALASSCVAAAKHCGTHKPFLSEVLNRAERHETVALATRVLVLPSSLEPGVNNIPRLREEDRNFFYALKSSNSLWVWPSPGPRLKYLPLWTLFVNIEV